MENQFLRFKKYDSIEEAGQLVDILEENEIEYRINDSSAFDPFFFNNPLNKEIEIQLKKEDFDRADSLLKTYSANFETSITDEHLRSMTDEELLEILQKQDEWSQTDIESAQKILKEHGREVNKEEITVMKAMRQDELAKPEVSGTGWIIAGYIVAFCGGFLGVFIGWAIANLKKTLPDGSKVYVYREEDRRHGRRIFLIGIIMFVLLFAYECITFRLHPTGSSLRPYGI